MAGNEDYEDKEVNDFWPWLEKVKLCQTVRHTVKYGLKKTVLSVKLKSPEYAFGNFNFSYKLDFKDV